MCANISFFAVADEKIQTFWKFIIMHNMQIFIHFRFRFAK